MNEAPGTPFDPDDEPELRDEPASLAADPPAAEPEIATNPAASRVWPRRLARAQGAFFFLSGIWPVLHLRSFLAVTGPKTDVWLVQTVGALLGVIGAGLLLGARRPRLAGEWQLVGAAASLVLAVVDVVFVTRGVIPPIYLADAAVELLIVAGWIACANAARTRS